MDITPLLPAHALPIRRYGDQGFLIGEILHTGSVLIAPQGVEALAAGETDAQIAAGIARALSQSGIEILLVGTGAQMRFIEDGLRDGLRAQGIASEVMDTGAACRTYNVLLSEGRRVAAVLVLPE